MDESWYVSTARAQRKAGRFDVTLSTVREGLKHFPDSLELDIENACIAMDTREYGHAVQLWNTIIEKYTDRAPAGTYVRLASAYRRLKHLDRAWDVIGRVLGKHPKYVDALVEAANVRAAEGRYPDVVEFLERAKSLAKTKGEALNIGIMLVHTYANANQFAAARDLISQLLRDHREKSESALVKQALSYLCAKEEKHHIGDPWKVYWNSRKNYVYMHVCRQIIEIVGRSATVVADIGSNRTPILSFLPEVPIRYSIDPVTPYTGQGVIPIYEDFLKWDPGQPIHFGICMQVMEHVPSPGEFAQRLLNLCEVVLVSVPYLEPPGVNPGHIHSNIDLDMLFSCFGREPNYHYIATELSGDQRIIALYDRRSAEKFPNLHPESGTAMRFRFRWSLRNSGLPEES